MKSLKNLSPGKTLIFLVSLCLCAILVVFLIGHKSRAENMPMEGPFVRLSLSGDSLPFSRAAFQCSRSIRRDISIQKKQMKEMENPGIIGKNGPPAKEAD